MITIKARELQAAMDPHDGPLVSYLDVQTGAVLTVADSPDAPEDGERLRAFKRSPKRYRRVPPLAPHELSFLMDTWVGRLPPGEVRRKLERALTGKQPLAAFARVLQEFPAAQQAWQAQKDEDLAYYAYRWVTKESVDAKLE